MPAKEPCGRSRSKSPPASRLQRELHRIKELAALAALAELERQALAMMEEARRRREMLAEEVADDDDVD